MRTFDAFVGFLQIALGRTFVRFHTKSQFRNFLSDTETSEVSPSVPAPVYPTLPLRWKQCFIIGLDSKLLSKHIFTSAEICLPMVKAFLLSEAAKDQSCCRSCPPHSSHDATAHLKDLSLFHFSNHLHKNTCQVAAFQSLCIFCALYPIDRLQF